METQQNIKIQDPIVWVDLEMSGLDVEKETILEIAVIVTDGSLKQQFEGPEFIIKTDKQILDNMGEWCKKHHGESGLTEKCLKSEITMEQAEQKVLDFLKSLNIEKSTAVLGGNSVHVDKKFLNKYMMNFSQFLHYRIIDVSTVKELCRRWNPTIFQNAPKKQLSHRALDDIIESIKELQYYQSNLFVPSEQN